MTDQIQEIEQMVKQGEKDESLIAIEAAQVRATLLQAAQLKRIADVLGRMQSGNDTVTLFSDEAWSILLADLSKGDK